MKKVVGIYHNAPFNESFFEKGCGGTETWVIQIAKKFVKRGYHTIIFCDCKEWVFTKNGVEYVPIELFDNRCNYQYFDYFIMTTTLNEYIYNRILNNGCKNIYVQSHDKFIWYQETYNEKYIYTNEKYTEIKKYIALTNFHKKNLHEYNQIPLDKIEVIGNGLDSDIFNEVDKFSTIRDNNILFTSVYTRGGDILVNKILPLVLKVIPDFNVHLCGYVQNFPQELYNHPHVKILGLLNKENYYTELRKHKVWFYPCVVPETFGICAPEAVMCQCDIVSPFEYGMKDICYPFINLKMNNSFKIKLNDTYHYSKYELNMSDKDFNSACIEAANRIIDGIQNYYNPDRINLRQSFKNFILGTYTWSNVVDKWINLFGR